MNTKLSDLRQIAELPPAFPRSALPGRALVFVHGIFSDHATFEPLMNGLLRKAPALNAVGHYFFDYDFYQTIPNSGLELARTLREAFPDGKTEITLVGHSMGGLVCRAALLQSDDLQMVKRLIMLGTPNHGTLQTARLGALAHLLREGIAILWTVFPQESTGIKELTEIRKTFDPLIRSGKHNTRHVEYVTIPGMRFNDESGWLESPQNTSAGLRLLSVTMAIMRAMPGMHAELETPHDGIVEESCVRLSSKPDHFSERPAVRPHYAPYVHLTHPDYHAVDHVTVQQADRTISVLAQLLEAPSMESWQAGLAETGEFNLFP
jgi:pimeloyl-ACP methyl ester carboxylesterase